MRHARALRRLARGLDGLLDGLAGDEPAREARRPAHAVARGELLERGAAARRWKKAFDARVEHQCVLPGGVEQVLDACARSSAARCDRGRGSGPRSRTMMPRVSSGSAACVDGLAPAGDAEVGAARRERLRCSAIDPALELARRDRRPHRRGEHGGRQHLVQRADPRADQLRRAPARRCANRRSTPPTRNRRAERDERARSVADRVAHHLGELAA